MKKVPILPGIAAVAVLVAVTAPMWTAAVLREEPDARPPLALHEDRLIHLDPDERDRFDLAMGMMRDKTFEEYDPLPPGAEILAEAPLLPAANDVEGSVLLLEHEGDKILRFQDFRIANGPNLHVYLATDDTATTIADLGPLRATEGDVHYDVPSDVDTAVYAHVLIWSVPFEVPFAEAKL